MRYELDSTLLAQVEIDQIHAQWEHRGVIMAGLSNYYPTIHQEPEIEGRVRRNLLLTLPLQ